MKVSNPTALNSWFLKYVEKYYKNKTSLGIVTIELVSYCHKLFFFYFYYKIMDTKSLTYNVIIQFRVVLV